MTQIANVRSFNGTSDEIELASTDLQSGWTNLTIAAIVKKDGGASFRWCWSIESTGESEAVLGQSSNVRVSLFTHDDGAAQATSNSADNVWTAAMGWCLVAATKADGASTVRLHRYRYDTQAWDHADAGTAGVDVSIPGPTAKVWLGSYDGTQEWMDCDIACAGVWKTTALSDPQLEGMVDDIASWEALSPTGLWLLNQTVVTDPVLDIVGAGDEVGRNGTTVVADATLPFDVGGELPVIAWITA